MPETLVVHDFHTGELEIERSGTHLIPIVIGPSGIGKDSVLEALDYRVVSTGQLLRERSEDLESLAEFLDGSGIAAKLETSGAALAGSVVESIRSGELVPPEVSMGLLVDRLQTTAGDERVGLSGAIRSEKELELFYTSVSEEVGSRCVFVYMGPEGETEAWRKELGSRYADRKRIDDNRLADKERMWREETAGLLKRLHQRGLPLVHINVSSEASLEACAATFKESMQRLEKEE
jgi:hypothetical protein